MRMPGVEPGSQTWEACMMPLHYMRRWLFRANRVLWHRFHDTERLDGQGSIKDVLDQITEERGVGDEMLGFERVDRLESTRAGRSQVWGQREECSKRPGHPRRMSEHMGRPDPSRGQGRYRILYQIIMQ